MDLAQHTFTGKRHIKMILLKKPLIQNVISCLTALCIAWGLKYHYSIAHADNLKWILAPTTALVETITGHLFNLETSTGYINHNLQIVIAPACAGVNFLIAAFCMIVFSGIFKIYGFKNKCIWLAGCAASAYIATICVNAVRIWVSIATISADIHAGWFTPQRIHRISGILIYFFFLSVFYLIIQKIICYIQTGAQYKHCRKEKLKKQKNRVGRVIHIGIIPLIYYWMLTIAVPWLNAAHKKDPAIFIEHCAMVGIGSISIFLLLLFLRPAVNIFSQRFSR